MQCTHIHTPSLTSIISILYFITFLLQFLPWSHTCHCWKIIVIITAIQDVLLIRIQFLFLYMLITTMHSYTIDYYCFLRRYFTVCALQFISFIFLSIQLTIVGNIKVRAVFCFGLIHFLYNLTHSIFPMQYHTHAISGYNSTISSKIVFFLSV